MSAAANRADEDSHYGCAPEITWVYYMLFVNILKVKEWLKSFWEAV